jgi:hypothetical protein
MRRLLAGLAIAGSLAFAACGGGGAPSGVVPMSRTAPLSASEMPGVSGPESGACEGGIAKLHDPACVAQLKADCEATPASGDTAAEHLNEAACNLLRLARREGYVSE